MGRGLVACWLGGSSCTVPCASYAARFGCCFKAWGLLLLLLLGQLEWQWWSQLLGLWDQLLLLLLLVMLHSG